MFCSLYQKKVKNKKRSYFAFIPLGMTIQNVEVQVRKGRQLARAMGATKELITKEGWLTTLRLPSEEVRLISENCPATIEQVGNVKWKNQTLSKAGSKCWLGKHPEVRGIVMNVVDHPYGGGEGRAPIGRKKPLTPWGYSTLGRKSRKRNKYSNVSILRRRK